MAVSTCGQSITAEQLSEGIVFPTLVIRSPFSSQLETEPQSQLEADPVFRQLKDEASRLCEEFKTKNNEAAEKLSKETTDSTNDPAVALANLERFQRMRRKLLADFLQQYNQLVEKGAEALERMPPSQQEALMAFWAAVDSFLLDFGAWTSKMTDRIAELIPTGQCLLDPSITKELFDKASEAFVAIEDGLKALL